MRLPIKL